MLKCSNKKIRICTLCEPDDGVSQIVSTDYQYAWKFDSFEELMATTDPRLLIYKQVVLFLNYNKPIKILTHWIFRLEVV